MVDFSSALAAGRARVEYVFHVCGMPWAVSTSADLITYLNGSGIAHKRTMFGAEHYNTTSHIADVVDIWPLLEVPGSITVRNEDAMSKLDGGTWTAKIADIPPGSPSWPFSSRATILGLEGVHAMAAPATDQTIKTGQLYEPMARGDTSFKFFADPGDRLSTAINSASAAAPVVVWIGLEAMTCSAMSGRGDVVTVTVDERGILETRDQYHSPNKITAGAPSILVSDAPLYGVTNRPCNLWAFVVDGEGADLTWVAGPSKLRHGKVSGDVSFDGQYWNINCIPWWKWLDTDLDVTTVEAPLDKFILTRPLDSAYDGEFFTKDKFPPHIVLREWDAGTTTMSDVEIWLCSEGSNVTYDTVEALETACITAINAASPNSWNYAMWSKGPMPLFLSTDMVMFSGTLPFLLDWGDKFRSGPYDATGNPWGWSDASPQNLSDYYSFEEAELTQQKRQRWPLEWFNVRYLIDGGCFEAYDASEYHNGKWIAFDALSLTHPKTWNTHKPKYILQWSWESADYGPDSSFSRSYFGVPYTAVDGTPAPRIWIDAACDVTNIGAGTQIQIGRENIVTVPGGPSKSFFGADSVGVGWPNYNYIILDDSHTTAGGMEAIKADDSNKIFELGQMLFAWDIDEEDIYFESVDPWMILQSYDIDFPDISDIFMSILGYGTHADDVAQEIQCDHIPDPQTVDWAGLDEYIDSSPLSGTVETNLRLRYNGKVNLFEMLVEELKFYGLTMTYEWDNAWEQYRIKFRQTSVINETLAMLCGRSIDDSNMESGAKVTAEHASAWQINAIELSVNWDPDAKEYKYKFDIRDRSGYEPVGGKITKLQIEPKITWVKNLKNNPPAQAALCAYMSNTMARLTAPRPAIKSSGTIEGFVDMGVCSELLATIDNIHDPFLGTIGISEWPCAISSATSDPSKGTTGYEIVMSSRRIYGWAPAVAITTSSIDGTTVTVTDIGGSGQLLSGTGATDGWYDHWFFADHYFNGSMSNPALASSDHPLCILVERGSKTPTVYTGVTCTYANTGTYAEATGGTFLTLTGVNAAYDVDKDWWLIFERYSQSLVDYQKKFVYVAGTDLMLSPSTGDIVGMVWI